MVTIIILKNKTKTKEHVKSVLIIAPPQVRIRMIATLVVQQRPLVLLFDDLWWATIIPTARFDTGSRSRSRNLTARRRGERWIEMLRATVI
jgi:hypothetical protein